MQIVVLADDHQKEELLAQGSESSLMVTYITDPAMFTQHSDADAYFDLQFEADEKRITILKQLTTKPVLIANMNGSLNELPENFIRINAWPTFLKRQIIEASASEKIREEFEKIVILLHKKVEWVADVPGFISARVVSMIINEAYFTLAEEVSSKEETDTAMKLGTNYPYGPFEWSRKIGLPKIVSLLNELGKSQPRYLPSGLLEKEAKL
jgi:3-hydroxybutyryl-CoA dehydrogenase